MPAITIGCTNLPRPCSSLKSTASPLLGQPPQQFLLQQEIEGHATQERHQEQLLQQQQHQQQLQQYRLQRLPYQQQHQLPPALPPAQRQPQIPYSDANAFYQMQAGMEGLSMGVHEYGESLPEVVARQQQEAPLPPTKQKQNRHHHLEESSLTMDGSPAGKQQVRLNRLT